ncbi:hypothetical protein HF638_02665 [Paenibacillus sp. SZ31]|uniref:hypothetical protein n=1 Tax=Paenibacillus sp. SZ31 TaxID=2725555 RepID=UPI00146B0759|nr:hypothetical protein [Paenibacillus sp. SZ31]NMI02858.1 hypothetical protein [Paenibacillus sp. SZ31]
MATVGDQLALPESGWRRYDDTHVGLKYTGTWTTPSPSNTVYYGGSIRVTSRAVDNNYVTFSFFGTKLRIISDFYSDRHSDNYITIDGVTEMYSAFRAVGSPSLQQSIVYEKTGLPLAFHTVTIATGHNRINFTLDAIDIDETGYLYGHALTSPETGWRRFDDTHDSFAYLGANWIAYTGANQGIYNNSHHYTSQGKGDTEIRFKFYGTKLRLISSIGPAFSNDNSVIIDGVTEKFNPRMPTTADERQKVTYEKTNLPLGIHEVKFMSGTNGDWRLDIDALDIDDNGYLVARVGQQLSTPEREWTRYDTDNYALYLGTDWKTVVNSTGRVFEGGSVKYSNVIGNYLKFSFTGDKLRLIAEYGSAYDTNVEVSIDGVIQYINLSTSSSSIQYQPQRIAFEQLGLTDGIHEVIVKKVSGASNFHIDAIDINATGRMIRLIGSQLTMPDEGWKRYDDSESSIQYVGTFTNGVGAGAYNGYSNYTSTIGDKIVFDFEGTKLRLIGARYTNRSDLIEVYVDGKLHGTHSQLGSELAQVLLVEIVGLPKAKHRIEMVNKSTSSTNKFMALDAVDIDSDGRLFHPDEVTSISELEVGKRIRCNYQALTVNTIGSFSGLGKQSSDLIPIASTTTPNGDFYFIMVEDWNGRKILVADRLIQIISWDSINASGMVGGVPISLSGNKEIATSIRLLTGGINASDKDNEWDKYIVNSTLNGKITAGDDKVWNWKRVTWTSTTTPSTSNARIVRGNAKVEETSYTISNNSSSAGFSPVLEVVTLPMNRSFIHYDGSYKRLYAGTPEIPETHASTDSVPPMTSSITPSGFASASGYASTYDAWQAFSDKPSGNMAWICNARTGWICYRFDVPIVITKYTILPPSDNTSTLTRSPKDWILEGSNNSTNGSDGTWITLDSVAGTTGWAMNTKKEFTFANVNSYLCYRIRITLNSGDTSYVSVWQIELMERINAVPAIPSKWNTISATLPSEDTFINDGMDDLSVFDRKNEDFVQTMTANGSLGSGKLFKQSIDLKKYFEITNISVK